MVFGRNVHILVYSFVHIKLYTMKKQTFSALIIRMNMVFILSVSIISVGFATDPSEGIGGKKKKSEKEVPETPSLKKRFIAELIAGGYYAPCSFGEYLKGSRHSTGLIIVESDGHVAVSSGSLLKFLSVDELSAERNSKKFIFKTYLLKEHLKQLSDGEYYKITQAISISFAVIEKESELGLEVKTPIGASTDVEFRKLKKSMSLSSSFFSRDMSLGDFASHLTSPDDFFNQVISVWSSIPDDLVILPEVIDVTDEF